MSRGLGRMQRLILDALARRPGGDWVVGPSSKQVGGPFAEMFGDFRLALGVHDLRVVANELARANGGMSHDGLIRPLWQASFSYAVRDLVERGLVEIPRAVPLAEDRTRRAQRLADGLYMPERRHQPNNK